MVLRNQVGTNYLFLRFSTSRANSGDARHWLRQSIRSEQTAGSGVSDVHGKTEGKKQQANSTDQSGWTILACLKTAVTPPEYSTSGGASTNKSWL